MSRLVLSEVTLCAATSVNLSATILALQECLRQIDFAQSLLFTDGVGANDDPRIRTIAIPSLTSGRAYSDFILRDLVDFITTPHCLIVQWDGFVTNADQWDRAFLDYDYVGAPWPQFDDGFQVGNGGFSLRSRKLLEACRDPRFELAHPEDVAICRLNRDLLEREHGLRFADRATAERFSFERSTPPGPTFGFHGVFNMIPILGADRFWQLYRALDDRSTAAVDYRLLMAQLGAGTDATRRRLQLTRDRVGALFAS